MADIRKIYKKIEEKFLANLEQKTSWGKEELKKMYTNTKSEVFELELLIAAEEVKEEIKP